MTNIYADSEAVVADLKSGRMPKGSILSIQHPSGANEAVRFHGWSDSRNAFNRVFMVGCNMSWDNLATSWYDLTGRIVKLIETPKPGDKRWTSR